MKKIDYDGYRFPPAIIQQAIWLYFRFTLSFRDVEDLLAERGITVSYETVRRWMNHFGPMIAADLRKRRPMPYTTWHLDEVYLKISGRMVYLWRAVDAEGEVLDVLVQSKRNKHAALKLMRKLLKKCGFVPDRLITDDLRSYGAAAHDLGISTRHERGRGGVESTTGAVAVGPEEWLFAGSFRTLPVPQFEPWLRFQSPLVSRVGDWRASLDRSLCSLLSRSFGCECHTISAMPRFQLPPRRTQHADFSHCALLFALPQGLWDLPCRSGFRRWSNHSIAVEQLQSLVQPSFTPPRAQPKPCRFRARSKWRRIFFSTQSFTKPEALAGVSHRK